MRYFLILICFLLLHTASFGQDKLQAKTAELELLKSKEKELVSEIEHLKLKQLIDQMKLVGLPAATNEIEIIEHTGLILGFDCNYKMASWAFHVLTPDVSFGNISRTNDFRVDDQVSCGSSVEADYFKRIPKADGTFSYDGFGFDRGHLAPSADFRWSSIALSESYFYSNMTPQRPEFNRESWAELETLLRTIVDQEKKSLYVITGPILNENLPVIEKSVNKLKIPEYHYKIIVDLSTGTPRGMAFLMPNKKSESRLSNYVVSIDSIEQLTGLDFFPNVDEQLESTIEAKANFGSWKTQTDTKNVEPLKATELPKGYYNTEQAASKVGSTVSIVGKVVSTKYLSKSQATFLNLDQSFPNQLFTVIIWKDGRRNFSYKPEEELDGKYIVVTGKVELDKNGIPGITVNQEEQIKIWEE